MHGRHNYELSADEHREINKLAHARSTKSMRFMTAKRSQEFKAQQAYLVSLFRLLRGQGVAFDKIYELVTGQSEMERETRAAKVQKLKQAREKLLSIECPHPWTRNKRKG